MYPALNCFLKYKRRVLLPPSSCFSESKGKVGFRSGRDRLFLHISVCPRATLAAEDFRVLSQESFAHQGDGALPTVEALTVPLAFLKADELGTSETSDGFGAGCTLFCIKMVVAIQAEREIIPGHKCLLTKLFPAAAAQKTLFMP